MKKKVKSVNAALRGLLKIAKSSVRQTTRSTRTRAKTMRTG